MILVTRTFLLGLVLLGAFEISHAQGNKCETIFSGKEETRTKKELTLEAATENLVAYKNSVSTKILEREFAIDPFLISLVAKEHILLIGPPGNAKTTLSKMLLSNIVDAETRQPSFYSMQMNKEVTLSDTHGSINFKKLSKGEVKRNYEEGLLGAKTGFIDEAFDIRPGAFRNILDVLAERAHSQGTKHHKGLTEIIIAATNKTLPEVYEEFNNSEQPRALIDRFAFVLYIPKEMESRLSDRAIFKGKRADESPVHQLTFQDLDVIRQLTTKVEVPEYLADLAAMIHYRLTPEFESREVKAMEQYREKLQNGEHTLPPFRAAKYLSPRTLAKAGNILRAIVALDYAQSGGKRELTATIDDLSKLRLFYQMNGPTDQALNLQLGRALKEYEKDQIKAVQTERSIVNPLFDSMVKEFNDSLARLNLHELDQAVRDYPLLPAPERRKVADFIKKFYQQSLYTMSIDLKDDVTSDTLAVNAAQSLVKDYIATLWKEEAPKIISAWEKQAGLREEDLSQKLRQKIARKQISYKIAALQGSYKNLMAWETQVKEEKRLAALALVEAEKRRVAEEQAAEAREKEEAEQRKIAEEQAAAAKAAAALAVANAPDHVPLLTLDKEGASLSFDIVGLSGDGQRVIAQKKGIDDVYGFKGTALSPVTRWGELTHVLPLGENFVIHFGKVNQVYKTINNEAGNSLEVNHLRILSSAGERVFLFDFNKTLYIIENGDKPVTSQEISGPTDFFNAAAIPGSSIVSYVTVSRSSDGKRVLFNRVVDKELKTFEIDEKNVPRDFELKTGNDYKIHMLNDSRGLIFKPGAVLGIELLPNGRVRNYLRYIDNLMAVSHDGRFVAVKENGDLEVYTSEEYFKALSEGSGDSFKQPTNIATPKHLVFSGDGSKLFITDDLRFESYDVKMKGKSQAAAGLTKSPVHVKNLTATSKSSGNSLQALEMSFSSEESLLGINLQKSVYSLSSSGSALFNNFTSADNMLSFKNGTFAYNSTKAEFLNKSKYSPPTVINSDQRGSIVSASSVGDRIYIFRRGYVQVVKEDLTSDYLDMPHDDAISVAAGIPGLPGANYVTINKVTQNDPFLQMTYVLNGKHEYLAIASSDFPADIRPENKLFMVDESRGMLITSTHIYAFRIQDGVIKVNQLALFSWMLAVSPDGRLVAFANGNGTSVNIFSAVSYVDSLVDNGTTPGHHHQTPTSVANAKHIKFSSDSSKIFVAGDRSFEIFDIKEDN